METLEETFKRIFETPEIPGRAQDASSDHCKDDRTHNSGNQKDSDM